MGGANLAPAGLILARAGPIRSHGTEIAMLVRDARDDDMAAVQAIYAHHVRHGTASFEEEPPALAEM